MNVLAKMLPKVFTGSAIHRAQAALGIGVWFCVGAFVTSSIAHYVDPFVAANLGTSSATLLGGFVTATAAVAAKIA
jgi:hypothetical protein